MNTDINSPETSNLDALLNFVKDAKEGKFTDELPTLVNIEVQEFESEQSVVNEALHNEFMLFGIA
jgi:hypothetical protein